MRRQRSGSGGARAKTGQFRDYTTEIVPGMVVLDAIHRIQATQATDLACRWNCKAGKCGSCSAEINGKPRLMCMTRLNDLPLDRAGDRRADAGVSADPGPGHRRVVELRGQEEDHAVQAAQAGRAGRHLADVAGGRRSRAGVPQVHRVLPVPGRLPRAARSRPAPGVHRAAVPRPTPRRSRCTRSTPPTARRSCARRTASATATSRSAARRCARSTSRSRIMRSFR